MNLFIKNEKHIEAMRELYAMGFTDYEKNLKAVYDHQSDISVIVHFLSQAK